MNLKKKNGVSSFILTFCFSLIFICQIEKSDHFTYLTSKIKIAHELIFVEKPALPFKLEDFQWSIGPCNVVVRSHAFTIRKIRVQL